MTSANVTSYTIFKDGVEVGTHSQHAYCHTNWHRLYKFRPWSEHTIQAHWEDEHEAPHEDEPENLKDFLEKRKPSVSDMKRFMDYMEKEEAILKEWADRYGHHDPALRLRTLNTICHSPL